jgi:hypothetical protein
MRPALALVALVAAVPASAAAQQAPSAHDSTRAAIQQTLRAFYFNLEHQDWEALTADILPAKVVAHRSAPEALVLAAPGLAGSGACAPPALPMIEEAIIILDGDWAEVSVPRCTEARRADQFRLIRFERRWRFVSIELAREPPPGPTSDAKEAWITLRSPAPPGE